MRGINDLRFVFWSDEAKGGAILNLRARWQDSAVRTLSDRLWRQWSSGSVLWQLLQSDASSYNLWLEGSQSAKCADSRRLLTSMWVASPSAASAPFVGKAIFSA